MKYLKTKSKVLAYILRNNSTEVLVFTHRDYPEAETQVIGGTVDPGEDFVEALLREIFEESGLKLVEADIEKKLGETHYQRKDIPEINHRHYFLIRKNDLPDSWAHTVHSTGADNGMVFEFFWMKTEVAKVSLTGQMGELLP